MLTAEGAMSIVRHSMRPQHVIRFQIIKKVGLNFNLNCAINFECLLEEQ